MKLVPDAQYSKHCPPTSGRHDNNIYKPCLPYFVDSSGFCPSRKEVKYHIWMHFTSGYKVLPAPSCREGLQCLQKWRRSCWPCHSKVAPPYGRLCSLLPHQPHKHCIPDTLYFEMYVKKKVFLHKRRLRIAKHYLNLCGIGLVWHPKWNSLPRKVTCRPTPLHSQSMTESFAESARNAQVASSGTRGVLSITPGSALFQNPVAVHNKKP